MSHSHVTSSCHWVMSCRHHVMSNCYRLYPALTPLCASCHIVMSLSHDSPNHVTESCHRVVSHLFARRGIQQLIWADANEILVAKKALYSMSLLTTIQGSYEGKRRGFSSSCVAMLMKFLLQKNPVFYVSFDGKSRILWCSMHGNRLLNASLLLWVRWV